MNNQDDIILGGGGREQKEINPEKKVILPSQKEHQLGVRVEAAPEIATPEQKVEQEISPEQERELAKEAAKQEDKEKISTAPVPTSPSSVQPAQQQPKTEMRRNIEKILAEDLVEIYNSLNEEEKKEFKAEGERVASKIEQIMQQMKIKAKEVLKLIRDWLKKIPGINRFFLIQEAKIKTDRILALKDRQ